MQIGNLSISFLIDLKNRWGTFFLYNPKIAKRNLRADEKATGYFNPLSNIFFANQE